EKQLALYGNQTAFRRRLGQTPASVGTFQIANVPAQGFVWDVTNPVRPVLHQGSFSGNSFSFTADSLSTREFVVFEGSNFPAPANVGAVTQQNLHALNLTGDLDLIIVTHPNFKTEAQRLAAHRTSHDGLNVAIVTPQQVYN